jgi:hypothetical protein
MSSAELKSKLALADLARELANIQEARKQQFAAIVRFVRHREAKGPAKDMVVQIARDKKLRQLLVDYEEKSEIIGMVEFVRDLKMKQSRRRSRQQSTEHSVAQAMTETQV